MSSEDLDTLPSVLPEPAEISVPGPVELQGITRQLFRGSGIYAATGFSIKALNFLLLALYSRFLRPSDYGIVVLAEVIAMLMSTVAGLGLNTALIRFYFQHANDRSRQQCYVSTLLRFSIGVATTGLTVAFVLGRLVPNFFRSQLKVAFFPYLALALSAAAATQITEFRLGLYQAEQQPQKFSRLALFSFLLTASGAIAFVVIGRMGAAGLLWGKLAGAACTACIAMWLLRDWWSAGWDGHNLRESLRFGLPLVPHQILALGLVAADRFILSHYRDLNEVGVYSIAYTMGMVMYMFTAAIGLAWGPMFYDLANQGESGRKAISDASQKLIAMLTLIACAGVLIAQPFTNWFLDARYAAAASLAPWIIASYLMHAFSSLFQQALLQAKRTASFAWVTALAFALNIILNLTWIPSRGMYGAAYATLAAYAIQALIMYLVAQAVFPLSYGVLRMARWLTLLACLVALSQMKIALDKPLMLALRLSLLALLALFAVQLRTGFARRKFSV